MTPLHLAVQAWRERRSLTQQQLAELSGVPQSRISEMERGITKHVSLEVLERLARALKVSPGELFGTRFFVRHDKREFIVEPDQDPPGVAMKPNVAPIATIYWKITTDGYAPFKGPAVRGLKEYSQSFAETLVVQLWPRIRANR